MNISDLLGFIANRKYSSSCFLPRVLVFKFFCKLFNFFADGRKPARHAFILNNKRDVRKQYSTKAKGGNRDVIERYDTHKGDIRIIRHSGPG